MYEMDYKPRRVCARNIHVCVSDDGKTVEGVEFTGGCNGNTKAVAKLVKGRSVDEVVNLLSGNTCGVRGTSCADQMCLALLEAKAACGAIA